MLLVMLLPPILLAHTIGEEIEERTMAYLWSRPLPRWSILLGKMVALTPILSFLMCLALVVPFFVLFGGAAGDHVDLLTGAMLSVVVATIAASGVTAGLATLVPRFGTVLGIGYLVLVDGTLAAIDTSISKLSVTYNAAALSGSYDPANYAAIGWLAGITAVWLGVAAWRIRRIE
jgi:ABC-2 type transport system permease protein